jgi:hypothetical protein
MRRLNFEFKEALGAAILNVSHNRQVVVENDLSPQVGVDLLRDLKCLIRSCH